jgi:hypothetical protein
MANGKRDVRVLLGDPFVCPACGGALQAPPLQAISANSVAGALAASALLVLTAGGAGFGAVRLARTASDATVAVLNTTVMPVQVARYASPAPAVAPETAPETQALGGVRIADNPPRDYTSLRLADTVATLNLSPSVPAAVYIAAVPPHPLALPISFGRPHAPEDDAPAQSAHWRHRGAWHRGYRIESASTASPPAEGAVDTAAAASGDSPPYTASDSDAAAAPVAQGNTMPVQQASLSVADTVGSSAAGRDSNVTQSAMTRLIVPAVDREPAPFASQDTPRTR